MKNIRFNKIYAFLAILSAILLSYCNYSIAETYSNNVVVGIGGMICYTITLISLIGLKHSDSGINANLRILSAIFFVIILLSNFAFSIFGILVPYYVACNGIILLIGIVLYLKLSET